MIACTKIEPNNDLHDFLCHRHRNRHLISTLLFPGGSQPATSSYISFVILHKRSIFFFTTGISFRGHGRQYGAGWLQGVNLGLFNLRLSHQLIILCSKKSTSLYIIISTHTHTRMLAGRRCCFCPVLLSGIITLPNIAFCFLLLACGSTLSLDALRYLVRYTNLCNLFCLGKLPRFLSWTYLRCDHMRLRLFRAPRFFLYGLYAVWWGEWWVMGDYSNYWQAGSHGYLGFLCGKAIWGALVCRKPRLCIE